MNTTARPVLVGQGLIFAEGLNFDRDGTLYCVDVDGGAVWRMLPGGLLQEWVRTGGRPNGSRFGPGGDLFVADCGRKAILRFSTATGQETLYADAYEGRPFLGPNDLCFGPDGTLYFTDPAGSSLTRQIGSVYAVASDGAVRRIATELAFPNGLAVTPDGGVLVVAETHTGILHRYCLDADHRHEEMDVLTTVSPAREPDAAGTNDAGPDGMERGSNRPACAGASPAVKPSPACVPCSARGAGRPSGRPTLIGSQPRPRPVRPHTRPPPRWSVPLPPSRPPSPHGRRVWPRTPPRRVPDRRPRNVRCSCSAPPRELSCGAP